MTTLVLEAEPCAADVTVDQVSFTVNLTDGRSLTVPLDWYPRLYHASTAERGNWRLLGDGHAIEARDQRNGVAALLTGV